LKQPLDRQVVDIENELQTGNSNRSSALATESELLCRTGSDVGAANCVTTPASFGDLAIWHYLPHHSWHHLMS
jgi:hypothetical protein